MTPRREAAYVILCTLVVPIGVIVAFGAAVQCLKGQRAEATPPEPAEYRDEAWYQEALKESRVLRHRCEEERAEAELKRDDAEDRAYDCERRLDELKRRK